MPSALGGAQVVSCDQFIGSVVAEFVSRMTGSTRKPYLVRAPLLTLIVVCQFAFSHAGTPAVIWCPQNESSDLDSALKTTLSNPLLKLSSEDFEESLSKLGVTEPIIVIAKELCVEDLKNNKVRSSR